MNRRSANPDPKGGQIGETDGPLETYELESQEIFERNKNAWAKYLKGSKTAAQSKFQSHKRLNWLRRSPYLCRK
jgi:hypothetical protein